MPHVASQKQPRVSKCPIVLEEFKFQVTIPLPGRKLPHLDSKNCLSCNLGPAPAGSRVLRVNYKGGSSLRKRPKTSSAEQNFLSQERVLQREIVSITVGVYRFQAEFVAQAMLQHHPFDLCRALPDNLLRVIFAILTEGPVFIMRHRLTLLAKWKAWKLELAEQERALHRELEPGVESILRSKSLLLLGRRFGLARCEHSQGTS